MNYKATGALFSILMLSTGCATTGQGGIQAKSITNDEAMAFEESLRANVFSPMERPERLYTQPLNKEQKCKIVTTKDQLARTNFRAFWDGQCKDGYAYGFGRDIALSDTHHFEEITTYAENGDNLNSPSVGYDFVNNTVTYRVLGAQYPANKYFTEFMEDKFDGFKIGYSVGKTDVNGNTLQAVFSPLSTTQNLMFKDQNIIYDFLDDTASPSVDASAVKYVFTTKDAATNTANGVGFAGYGNGQVRHFKINGDSLEEVILPTEYLAHVNEKYKAIVNARNDATNSVEAARELERRYLFKTCNGDGEIQGLDTMTATKICTWRDQFKELYKTALANHTAHLEEMRRVASNVEQQRQVQAQLAAQRQLVQQQLSQQSFQRSMDSLRQTTQDLQNSNSQILNGIMSQPVPQVAPLNLPSDNRVTCITVGRVTNCQ